MRTIAKSFDVLPIALEREQARKARKQVAKKSK